MRRFLWVSLISLAACKQATEPPQVCLLYAAAGISVGVQDSVTGARFPFSDLRFEATDGLFTDSLRVQEILNQGQVEPHTYGLAWERAGTYRVIVRASGYAPWTKSGIVVPKEGCHVVTQSVMARLVKQP